MVADDFTCALGDPSGVLDLHIALRGEAGSGVDVAAALKAQALATHHDIALRGETGELAERMMRAFRPRARA